MDSILQAIEDWFRGLLVSGIMEHLTSTFDSVNNQVGQIATEVGQTPANFSPAIYNMIRKVMFNLTKRQLICFGVAALIGVPSFFLIKQIASTSTAAIGMMVIMMPFFFLAMYEKNGQHLEVILGHLIEATFVRPKERPYKTDNKYAALKRYAEADQEIMEIIMYSEAMRLEKKKGGDDVFVF